MFDYAAPTGVLVFGNYGAGWAQCVGHLDCVQGLSMIFHQPVDWVSLKAINGVYSYKAEEAGNDVGFGLPAEWIAFVVVN